MGERLSGFLVCVCIRFCVGGGGQARKEGGGGVAEKLPGMEFF